MKKIILISFCFFVLVTELYSVDKIYLNDGWEFRKVGDSVWYPASVPGTVHTDLFNNGLIPDPFYRDNEKDLQWIENEDWEYRCEFNISDSVYNKSNIDIMFEGLDTYAKIYLNDSLIITADNMFRKWEAECKKFIRAGKNNLYILFESPIKKAKELKSGPELPGGDRVYTRKAAYQCGWDLGPRFVTSGIWKGVYIEPWSVAKIGKIWTFKNYNLNDEIAKIIIDVNTLRDRDTSSKSLTYLLLDIESNVIFKKEIKLIPERALFPFYFSGNYSAQSEELTFQIDKPKLWWCYNLGYPYIYNYKLLLLKNGKTIDEKKIKIGLRKIELIQDNDVEGQSFYFKLNGIPIFIKGANYIPQNNFIPRVTKEKYKRLINNAVESNINMLRVWGGGVYGDEEFYDLCDEKGILIWQDFMFANSMYPGNKEFLLNVDLESNESVHSLSKHPCISLYCGNNEIEEGWNNWGWQTQLHYTQTDSENLCKCYQSLFDRILPLEVINNGLGVPYIPTTPKIGWGHPEAMTEGDSHYWGVWWGMEPFEMYEKKIPRFMSEYGFQSFPDMKTIEKFTLPEDRYLYSPVMKAHQKHPAGYETIQTYMEREYKQPKDFESYVYVSQLLQAYGIKRAIEAHRSAKPYCMGTMYWQLDDCWPGVTWSGIDYYGRWKAMQYFVKDAYKDILVSVHEDNDSVKVYIVSDNLQETKGNLQMMLVDFNGTPLNPPKGGKLGIGFDLEKFLTLQPNSSAVYFVISKKDLIQGHSLNDIVLSVKFIDNEGNEYKNLYYFVPPKDLALEDPGLSYKIDNENGDLIITTNKLAKNVHVVIDDPSAPLNLENNYFDMLPGETVRLNISNNIEKSGIKVTSLYDTY